MTKIVTNRCYGGFGLSHAGVLAYARHAGITLYPEYKITKRGSKDWTYWRVPEGERPEPQDDWENWSMEKRVESNAAHTAAELSTYDFKRDDPALVAAVEELGEESYGDYSKLEVTEIPDDVEWTIEEYDGLEHIAERHQTW